MILPASVTSSAATMQLGRFFRDVQGIMPCPYCPECKKWYMQCCNVVTLALEVPYCVYHYSDITLIMVYFSDIECRAVCELSHNF
jgi:hypothetical protein